MLFLSMTTPKFAGICGVRIPIIAFVINSPSTGSKVKRFGPIHDGPDAPVDEVVIAAEIVSRVLDHFFCRHDRDRSYGLPASPEPGVQNEIKDVAHAKVVRRKCDRRKAVIAQSTP